MDKLASEIVERYTQTVQTTIASPEKLKEALPIIDGKKLQTEEEVVQAYRKGRILESQANEYISLIRYVGSLPKKTTPGEGEGKDEPEAGGAEGLVKKLFGGGSKKDQGLRKPKGNP
jgi:hypothetical protein